MTSARVSVGICHDLVDLTHIINGCFNIPPNIHWLRGLCSSHNLLKPGARCLCIVSLRRSTNWELPMLSNCRPRSSSALSWRMSRENSGVMSRNRFSFPLCLWRCVIAVITFCHTFTMGWHPFISAFWINLYHASKGFPFGASAWKISSSIFKGIRASALLQWRAFSCTVLISSELYLFHIQVSGLWLTAEA